MSTTIKVTEPLLITLMLLPSEEIRSVSEEEIEEEIEEDSENLPPDLEEEEEDSIEEDSEEFKAKEVVINFPIMEANFQDLEEDLIITNVNFFLFF